MKEFIFIRHGETDYNAELRFLGSSDIALNKEGQKQAKKLKKVFAHEKIARVYSSDLERCRETVSIINKNVPVVYSDKLREMDFGIFEGLTYEEANRKYREECDNWVQDRLRYVIPDGESLEQMARRVLEHFQDIYTNYTGKTVIVSHAGCIRVILNYYLWENINDIWRIFIGNCSITRLCFDKEYAYLKSLNENG